MQPAAKAGLLHDLLNIFRFDDVTNLALSVEAGAEQLLGNYDLLNDNQGQWISRIPVGSLTHVNLLHVAVWYAAHDCLAYLLDHGFGRDASKPTSDGTTPLHLAAALGDFVATELLIRYGSSTRSCDQFGRIPLHHAATTDICVAVQLCAQDPNGLYIRDWETKDPLEIAFANQSMKTARFLALTLQNVTRRADRKHLRPETQLQQLSRKALTMKESSLWIPYHITAPRCIKIEPNIVIDEEICECNLPINEHPERTKNPVLAKRFAAYKKRFVRVPTPTYGELTHPANNYVSQYVRSADDMDLSKLAYFFESVWSLQRPQLVLTFYGSEASSSSVKESLRKLVWKVSDSTLTWILTDGLQRGISSTVSEATKHYIEAYGLGLVESIGIVPWRRVCSIPNLSPDTYLGNNFAKHEMTKEDSVLHENIDANLTAYFFVDTEDRPPKEATLIFRSKMEAALKNWAIKETLDETQLLAQSKIQMCGILSGGDEHTLRAFHQSLTSGTPFVVLKETGGLADILTACIEDQEIGERNVRKKALTEGSSEGASFQLSPANIRETVMSYWESIEHPDIVVLLIQDILEKRERLCVCDVDEEELDYHVLLLLIGPPTEEADTASEANIAKLEIAIALNRSDVAQQKVFLDGLKWDNERLGAYMTSFLLRDNVPFMKLFLEKGFDLKSYLTRGRLETLYTLSLLRATQLKQKKPLLNAIRHFMKTPTRVSLLVIGKMLTLLMGNRFYPVYLEGDFTDPDEKASSKTLTCPATHLFVWALLTERKDSAELFWTQVEEPLGAALLAAALLRHYCQYADSVVNRDELEELSISFERKACGLLSECYVEDPASTAEVLIRERTLFGHMSCMMLAANGKCLDFVAHRCSEQYLELVWCGDIDPQTHRFAFFVSLLVGIVMPPLVPFTLKFSMDRRRGRELQEDQELKRPVSNTSSTADLVSLTNPTKTKKRTGYGYWRKLVGFYNAPMVRFAYATLSHIVFLCFFIYALLFDYQAQNNFDVTTKLLLLLWVFTYFVENVRQGVSSGLTFRDYMKRIWKSLELVAIILFVIGTGLHLILVAEVRRIAMPIDITNNVQYTVFRLGQIFYGMSLFFFFYRLMEAFTADIKIGPLVVTIQSMIVKDLIPFLSLLVVALFSFALLNWVVAYNGTASHAHLANLKTLFEALKLAYYQMSGDYNLDSMTSKKSDDCKENKLNCVDAFSEWLAPITVAIFVILTQVLLMNLLIAMFSSTYERIESSATGYWSLQRYQVICEFVERSVFPPPLIIFWHIYLLFKCCGEKCRHTKSYGEHPFKKSYPKEKASSERRLIQWERLRFWDYQRYVLHGRSRRKNKAAKSINVRTTVVGGQGGGGGTQLTAAIQSLQDGTNEGIRSLLDKINRVDEVDRKADQILKLLKGIQEELEVFRSLQPGNGDASLQLLGVPHRKWPKAKLIAKGPRSSTTSTPFSPIKEAKQVPKVQTGFPDVESPSADKPSNMMVVSGDDHKLAMFYPPTSDSTPSLYAEPIPWDSATSDAPVLGWKPQYQPLEDWSEPNDFLQASTLRECNPMGTGYQPPADQIPPDPMTGMPRNPNGRTGVVGKGLLPAWGANPAIILVLTRYVNPNEYGRGELQVAVCELQITRQLPWLLVRHSPTCDGVNCSKSLVNLWVNTRAAELCFKYPAKRDIYRQAVAAYHQMTFTTVYKGYVNDMINTDNAWIEPTAINLHLGTQTDGTPEALLHLFAPEDCNLRWTRADDGTAMRTSHRAMVDMTIRQLEK